MAAATLLTSLADLAERLERTPTLEETADAVAAFARTSLGVDQAGLSVHDPGGAPQRLASTSPLLLAQLDDLRARLGQGPGTEVLAEGAVVTVADTLGKGRWPGWRAGAAAQSVRGVRAVGLLPLRGRTLTLELYSSRPHVFDPDDPAPYPLVREAGLVMAYADRVANLQDAVDTRALIGRAQGIVMERYSLTAEQAMSFLRRTSQSTQVKIRDLAGDLARSVEPGDLP